MVVLAHQTGEDLLGPRHGISQDLEATAVRVNPAAQGVKMHLSPVVAVKDPKRARYRLARHLAESLLKLCSFVPLQAQQPASGLLPPAVNLHELVGALPDAP